MENYITNKTQNNSILTKMVMTCTDLYDASRNFGHT